MYIRTASLEIRLETLKQSPSPYAGPVQVNSERRKDRRSMNALASSDSQQLDKSGMFILAIAVARLEAVTVPPLLSCIVYILIFPYDILHSIPQAVAGQYGLYHIHNGPDHLHNTTHLEKQRMANYNAKGVACNLDHSSVLSYN